MTSIEVKSVIAVTALLLLVSCSTNRYRSEVVMDTGLPLSELMRSYDVDRYILRHEILVDRKAIRGSATTVFEAISAIDVLELDFDGRFDIELVEFGGAPATFERNEAKLYIDLGRALAAGESGSVTVHYAGRPVEAERPPWEGGFTWEKTPSGEPWIATSFQGEGCDIWWPCKDHPNDEPTGVDLYITVPANLTVAANGVLIDTIQETDDRVTFHWQTNVPTNLYGIALNIAPYVLIEDTYESTNGVVIPVVFFAIEDHEEDARELFERDMRDMIEFFERRLGPFPWGDEKIGIAETPHLGMEHQTINAYGNEFRRDAYGFDWLLHHEFAHEWFGNLVSMRNYADLWIHEGTGAYMQTVYTEELMGEAAAHHRMYRAYLNIDACLPVAPREAQSNDQMADEDKGSRANAYSKGAWVVHSLRYLLGEDRFWAAMRIFLYDTADPASLTPPIQARHRTTDDLVRVASDVFGGDLAWFFDVYVRGGEIPALTAAQDGDDVILNWEVTDNPSFNMPIPVLIRDQVQRIEFSSNSARLENAALQDIQIDPEMKVLRHLPSLPTCEEQRAEKADAD